MPFSPELTQLIKAKIQEKLRSSSLGEWQHSFLTNMDQKFAQYGEKTRLSTAQYRKLHEILEIEQSVQPSQGQSNVGSPRRQASPSPLPRRSSVPVNPLRVTNTPRRAVRRFHRQLIGPILIVFFFFGMVSALFESSPTPAQRVTSAPTQAAPSVWYVTGNSVNQRSGPGTNYGVMGRLSKGIQVKVLDRQNGWSKISSSLGDGWMSTNYLSQNRTTQTVHQSNAPRSFSYAEFQTLRARDVRIIDGDTIAIPGLSENMRLVGFNTPETYRAKCPAEKNLGNRATARLSQLVASASNVQARRVACACRPGTEGTSQCNFGRFCGILLVDGQDVGKILIGERLAVPFHCGRTSCPRTPGNWCQ